MKQRISKIASAVAATLLCGVGSAQAALIVDDWTLNLTGVDGLAATVVNDINWITFSGIANAQHVIDASGGTPDAIIEVGDIGRAQGLLDSQLFYRADGSKILGGTSGLGNTYEMTFTFDVLNVTTILTGPDQNFTHLGLDSHAAAYSAANSTGLLNIYIDAFANGGTLANQGTGAGYNDGVLIATFAVLFGNGGVFNAITYNGSDDATFELVWARDNTILSGPGGVDIAVDGEMLAMTSTQFDADANNDGTREVVCPSGTNWGSTGPTNFCALEDGRAYLAVPEPASLALLGLGLVGLGLNRRRALKV